MISAVPGGSGQGEKLRRAAAAPSAEVTFVSTAGLLVEASASRSRRRAAASPTLQPQIDLKIAGAG